MILKDAKAAYLKTKTLLFVVSSIIYILNTYLDNRGKVYIWKDESEQSPIKNANNSTLFELSNH